LLLHCFKNFREDPVPILSSVEQFAGLTPYFNPATGTSIKVNSVGQYNWQWLTWMLSRESVISAIDTLFLAIVHSSRAASRRQMDDD
jgi:hypothetical protein